MKILILTNHQAGLYNFRKELLEHLIKGGNEVYVSVPKGDFYDELTLIGTKVLINDHLVRRGTNPIKDLNLLLYYDSLIKTIQPDVVLTYTIKSNIYGGYLCGKRNIPYISTVTGLGTSLENNGLIHSLTLKMYELGLKKARKVFFQNKSNLEFMLSHKIVQDGRFEIVPGSGVNVQEYSFEPYPEENEGLLFSTIGRIMKDKGIYELIAAARTLKQKYPKLKFRLIGDYDDSDLRQEVEKAVEDEVVEYIPFQKDIKPYLKESNAVIHPSYHEGLSNVLLETASIGRPVIASNVPGCIETFEPGITGIAFEPRSIDSLIEAIEHFVSLSCSERRNMGIAGRNKVINEFDRSIVINQYIHEIESCNK